MLCIAILPAAVGEYNITKSRQAFISLHERKISLPRQSPEGHLCSQVLQASDFAAEIPDGFFSDSTKRRRHRFCAAFFLTEKAPFFNIILFEIFYFAEFLFDGCFCLIDNNSCLFFRKTDFICHCQKVGLLRIFPVSVYRCCMLSSY